MPNCSVNFSALRRREHAIALMIAEHVQNSDEWFITGQIPEDLQHVLTKARVKWKLCDVVPAGTFDMTESIIRITEVERGVARYIHETDHGTIAIVFQNYRYRVLIGADVFGAYTTPREAVAALHRSEAQAIPVGNGKTIADCGVPLNLSSWTLMRIPERASMLAGIPGGSDGLPGLARAAQTASSI
jgi:hypothetical protein